MGRKVSRKPKTVSAEDELFNAGPFEDPELNAMGDDPAEKGAKSKDDGPSLEDLTARIDALQRDNERVRRTNLALLSQPPQAVVHSEPEEPKLDMSGLPDPVTDPDAYQQQLAVRTSAFVDAKVRHATAPRHDPNAGMAARTAALWEDFTTEYPDYEGMQEQVEFAATKAIAKMTKRGVDPQKYVFGATDDFFEDVDKEMKRIFKSAADDDDEPRERRRTRNTRRREEDDDIDDGRTDGIHGAGVSPFARSRKGADDDGGDFLLEIYEQQKKAGFIH